MAERRQKQRVVGVLKTFLLFIAVCRTDAYERERSTTTKTTTTTTAITATTSEHRNAYATMMYMGTPRDYEFYVATRVLIRSLAKLQVDADLVVIASHDVPVRWVQAL